ncbi:MAG: peptide chain release factor N(5)-glutamine methyltransferase [Candidatus Neomarinimicrobiota bacterium]|nr:peptide chain release factor N(5)-glutamine methyltransferase [Candidatus Neomarinimicrobiota bacterium]
MDSNYLLNNYLEKQLFELHSLQIDEYKNKSEIIIQNIIGISKTQLYTKTYSISQIEFKRLENAFSLLKENAPVQHILEESYFYNDKFFTPPGVFIPRPESELIIDCVNNDFSFSEKKTVLDIGSGSGCLSISLGKLYKDFSITGIDISHKAIEVSRKNAKGLNASNVKFVNKDFFNINLTLFDIIISNPPYIAISEINNLDDSVSKHDPFIALSDQFDGLSFYKYFIDNIDYMLKKDGTMYLEIPNSNITDKIIDIVNKKPNITNEIFKDFEGNDRVIKIYFNTK